MNKTCISLFSGGLDSMLAIKLMTNQGIKVNALFFDTGFNSRLENHKILEKRANEAGANFYVIDLKKEYLEILLNPIYGYGKNFNPCIDCHGFMMRNGIKLLKKFDASFIISGEVLAQRPMSQNKNSLNIVKKLSSDTSNLILRPLSAKLLEPTLPEIKGIVDRSRLEAISGRGRKRQLELAKIFNFSDFASPAGGCLLTMENFAKKIKDALKWDEIDDYKDAIILKFGRHLRLSDNAKLIIGRDESDNNALNALDNKNFLKIRFDESIIGAHSFIRKNASLDDRKLAASIALAYTKCDKNKKFDVFIEDEIFKSVIPFKKEDALKFMI